MGPEDRPQVVTVNPAARLPAGRAADIFTGVLDCHDQPVRGVLNIDNLQRTGQQEGIHRPVLASVVRKARGTGLGARRLRKSREWPDNLSAGGQVGERTHSSDLRPAKPAPGSGVVPQHRCSLGNPPTVLRLHAETSL